MDENMSLPRMIHRICCRSFVAFMCGMPLSGCGGSANGYQAVSGAVTFQGKPVQDGAIQFCTDGAQRVVCGGAMIRDGKYQLPREHGLKPGSYLVKISSAQRIANPDKAQAEMNPFRTRELIPAKFNTNSELKIEVRADEPAQFNFDLQSLNKRDTTALSKTLMVTVYRRALGFP